jgi:Protein of unknown function (DUF4254)
VRPEAASSENPLPTSDHVVAAFRRALRDPTHRSARPLDGLLLDLLTSNLDQWDLEDKGRGPGVDDATVAETKRAIDRLNAGRHQLVEAIDAAIDQAVTQNASAPLATETPAMAFDRLSVLVIRIHHTERAAGEEASAADRYAARLPVLHRQLADLQKAIDRLIEDVRAGTRRFVPYRSLKLYGQ